MLFKSVSVVALAAASSLACAAHASDGLSDEGVSADGGEIIVIGSGQTRSVSTLLPSNLDVLPPGTSAQKALNRAPAHKRRSIFFPASARSRLMRWALTRNR